MNGYLVIERRQAFWEYPSVLANTQQQALLEQLSDLQVVRDQVVPLVTALTDQLGIPPLHVAWARRVGRSQSSFWYKHYDDGPTLRLERAPSLEVVAHEFAHYRHWWAARRHLNRPSNRWYRPPFHGWDFTWRLDDTAARIAKLVGVQP